MGEKVHKKQKRLAAIKINISGGKLARDFVITNSNSIRLGKKKKTVTKGFTVGPNAIKFIALTIVAVLAVVYLSQSTAGASRSIKVRDIESKKDELILERERLEAEQTRLKALKEIDSGIEKQVMEPVSSINFTNNKTNLAKVD